MIEWAYTMDIWKRVGCTPESKRLVLRKKKIHPNKKDPHYFYDSLRRELSVDIFDMSDENMERYCQAIEYYKPEFVHGYTSAIVMLARFVERRPGGLKHQFKALLATSETIFPEQKKYVEMVFGCRMFSFYGHSERLVIAGSCEAGDAYHVEPTYGYCELLDENGQQADCGEMVTTGFLNDAMPLIRYRTKDLAEWDLDDTCACGRNSRRLKRVYGRVNQDMLVTDEGTVIAPNIYSSEIGNVICYKLIQNQPGIVTMQVVPGEGYDDQCAQNIKNTLEKRVSGHIRFDVVAVQHIPVLENGKHRVVEQHLSCGKL